MKKLIFLQLMMLAFSAIFGQDSLKTNEIIIPEMELDDNGRAMFQLIVEQKGTKDALYLNGKTWVFDTYKSGKAVIQMEDKEGGVIIGNGRTGTLIYKNMGVKVDAGNFKYTITLNFKDGKYRCIIDNITYKKGELLVKEGADYSEEFPHNWSKIGKKYNKKQWGLMKEQALVEFQSIFVSLQEFMNKKPKKDNW